MLHYNYKKNGNMSDSSFRISEACCLMDVTANDYYYQHFAKLVSLNVLNIFISL